MPWTKGADFPTDCSGSSARGEVPYAAVGDLITKAQSLGIDAHLIENEAFDELMSDIVRFLSATASKLDAIKGVRPPRLGSAPIRRPNNQAPIIRTNALGDRFSSGHVSFGRL